MFVKIELHEIPPFFVSAELENEVIKNMVTEFEKDRSQYGYKNLTLKEKYNTRKEFCKRFNLKIEHDSIIALANPLRNDVIIDMVISVAVMIIFLLPSNF